MGGVGKTALALKYAWLHLQDYPVGICWLDGQAKEPLVGFMEYAAEYWQVRIPEGLEVDGQLQYLQRNLPPGPALIVLDNYMGEYPAFIEILPAQYRVLLTSREDPGPGFEILSLEVLSPAQALDLLAKVLSNESRVKNQQSQAESLCAWLGHLPLALELVGYYLRWKPDLSLAEMEQRLRKKSLNHPSLTGGKKGIGRPEHKSVWAALELSQKELTEGALELMYLLAHLGSAKIPLALIESITEQYAGDEYDEEAWGEVLDELLRHSMLVWPEEGYYRLHPLVREYFQLLLEPGQGEDLRRAVAFCLAREAKEVKQDVTLMQAEAVADLVPHWEWACEGLTSVLEEDELFRPFEALVRYYQMYNQLEMALRYSKASQAVCESILGAQHWTTATSLNNLAILYDSQGKYSFALPLHERALTIFKKVLGAEHPTTAASLNNLAESYSSQGKYDLALSLFERALVINEKVLGADHPITATNLNNLAGLYRSQGRYDSALPLYERALAIYEQVLGAEHPNTATCLNGLALLYKSLGNYDSALPLYERALAIYEKVFGLEHPYTVANLNNLAEFYSSQGKYDSALPLHKNALAISKKTYGDEHPNTAASLNNLAEVYSSQGKYGSALSLYERSLAINEKVLGAEHPTTATNLNNLAGLYCSRGKYDIALPLYERALAIYEQALGAEHPNTAACLNGLASLYEFQDKYDSALPLYERALVICEKVLGVDHPNTKTARSKLKHLKQQMQ